MYIYHLIDDKNIDKLMGYLLSTILLKQFTHHMKNDFKNINSSIKNCQVQIRRNNKDIFNAIKISLYFNDI